MAPIVCNYYITYRCNARCKYCDFWKRRKFRQANDCSPFDVAQNLSALRKIGIRFIDFTGGEPLLHPDLPELLRLAKGHRFWTSVTTNCLLYPERAQELRGLVDLLHFSLDSIDPHVHDALRGCESYESVMQSIEIARSLGESPDLLFTVTPANVHAIEALISFAQSQKLILIVNPIFRYSNQEVLAFEALDYLDQFCHEKYVYINRAFHRLIRNGGNRTSQPRCRAMSASVVISPENELLLPCFHHAQWAIPLNNDLIQIVQSQTYRSLIWHQGTFPFCQGCTINCYFDPSFLYKLDRYFWLSLISKTKYAIDKYLGRVLSKIK
ncbi:MAG: radical SAM protein [candidate division KSB1 bacterium]|nr:radical SAM protein [candidate division KSB1 bacterium]